MTKKFKIILIPACDSIFLPGDLVSYQGNIESLAFDGDDNYILYAEAGHEAGRIHKRYVAGWNSILLEDTPSATDIAEERTDGLNSLEVKILSFIQSRDAADCDEHCEVCREGSHDKHFAKQLARLVSGAMAGNCNHRVQC